MVEPGLHNLTIKNKAVAKRMVKVGQVGHDLQSKLYRCKKSIETLSFAQDFVVGAWDGSNNLPNMQTFFSQSSGAELTF